MASLSGNARPTLMTLARELGVSRQTVSNVINAPHVVRPETRTRVEAAIKAAGYRPSAAGRALRTQRSMRIALRLFPASDGINGAVMDRFVHSLAVEAQRSGYRIVLFAVDDTASEIESLRELHRTSAVDAAILTDTSRDDPRPAALVSSGIPFAAFGRPWNDVTGATHPWVDIDGAAGTEAATRSLRDAGHERIGFLGWPSGSGVGDDRRAGWRRALAEHGDPDEFAVAVEDGAATGAEGAAVLRSRGATAVVCSSDSLALGALAVFGRGGAPGSVIGFDDTPVARAVGLSSITQPVEAAAAHVLAMALAVARGKAVAEPHLLLEPELRRRDLETFIQ